MSYSKGPRPSLIFYSDVPVPSRPDFARGYGGKFGVEKDKMDKSAVDTTYQAPKVGCVCADKAGVGAMNGEWAGCCHLFF